MLFRSPADSCCSTAASRRSADGIQAGAALQRSGGITTESCHAFQQPSPPHLMSNMLSATSLQYTDNIVGAIAGITSELRSGGCHVPRTS
jgi:hypothetical protein